jgi:hypothetical protein
MSAKASAAWSFMTAPTFPDHFQIRRVRSANAAGNSMLTPAAATRSRVAARSYGKHALLQLTFGG